MSKKILLGICCAVAIIIIGFVTIMDGVEIVYDPCEKDITTFVYIGVILPVVTENPYYDVELCQK